ncbi:unnamed protein product [Notodromas monacha]|uniref:Superoxide dismutase [Cu-Zn] n=1 Tax=Notodromas monacha TaxID=399045 RepID=A0A7R9GFY4_9CRUS|nr:unnamed protein product [Notodromas monacha]CAG0919627.1 unnamed protein product [Notodromas monacha]
MEGSFPRAVCVLKGAEVSGKIFFIQQADGMSTKITGQVMGLKQGLHAFHIHEYGDNTSGCSSAGPHFNPFKKPHGGPDDTERHLGDLGNMLADANGVANLNMEDKMIRLDGPHSILGRALVIHADPDDFGRGGDANSRETGNSGARLACGIIGLAPPHQSNI